MAKSGPHTHTHYKVGVPGEPGWYATKSVFSDFRWHTNVRRVRRYFDGKNWSMPVLASIRNQQTIQRAKNCIDTAAHGMIMYSALRRPR